jgi:hypothetical protein
VENIVEKHLFWTTTSAHQRTILVIPDQGYNPVKEKEAKKRQLALIYEN